MDNLSQATGQIHSNRHSDTFPSNFYEGLLWNSASVAVVKLSRDWCILEANPVFCELIGFESSLTCNILGLISADDAATWFEQVERMRVESVLLNYLHRNGSITSLRSRLYSTPIGELLVAEAPVHDLIVAESAMATLNNEMVTLARESARQASELKEQTRKLSETLLDLENSFWHIRKDQELLPICMCCQNVHSEPGLWEPVSDYLQRTSSFLTHGLCPGCLTTFQKV